MSNLLTLDKASLTLGTATIFDEVSGGIHADMRIGVVGRNGGGKTTLLRVLAGAMDIDTGRVARQRDVTWGMLSQADQLHPEHSVRQAVMADRASHEWASQPRIRDILEGLLGGSEAAAVGGWEAPVGPMSGGERRRIALAALLVSDPDVLLLDEPTNHLDIEGVAWLAHHLAAVRTREGTALVTVTHDRWFLDAVATHTWEVADGRIHQYEGGYAAYVLAKAERERREQVASDKRDNLLRKELAWLRRGAPARTSKPKFRLDAASALISDEPEPRNDVELMRFATTRLGKDVLDCVDATLRLGDRTLLDHQTWRLGPGDRIGIVGVNGSGKSTLLRVLAGEQPLDAGRVKRGKTVQLAFLSQEVRELDRLAGTRVIDAVSEVRQVIQMGDKEVTAGWLTQRLGFVGPRQFALVGDLSGGERRRLQFLRLLMTEPNVLILDEPTNDFDIDTLAALEDVLDGWVGTLLVVSHDRYALERMCDRYVALYGDGAVVDLPGGVDQYLRVRAEKALEEEKRGEKATATSVTTAAPSTSAQQRQARKDMARVERSLDKLAVREEKLHHQLAEAAMDHTKAAELHTQLHEVHAERESLEAAWLEASELVE